MSLPPKLIPFQTLGYSAAKGADEGVFVPLLPRLSRLSGANDFSLEGKPTSKRLTLWIRHGAKKVFYVSLIRRTGKCMIEMGGLSPAQGLAFVRTCRDHFDQWFGLAPDEIRAMEKRFPTSISKYKPN